MTVTPMNPRERLARLRGEIGGLREERAKLRREYEDAKKALMAVAASDPDTAGTTPEMTRLQAIGMKLGDIEGQIERYNDAEGEVLSVLGGRALDYSRNGGGPSYSCLSDPGVVAQLERWSQNPDVPIGGARDLGQLVDPEAMASMFGSGLHAAITDNAPGLRTGPSIGIVPGQFLHPRLIDVLPSAPAPDASKTYSYAVESGTYDTAQETAEDALSPEAGVTLTDATVTYRVVRHYIKVGKDQLSDIEGLQARLAARLTQGLLNRLENQVISGDGLGENLRGLLATTGLGNVPFAVGALPTDQIRKGISSLETAGAGPANFSALSVNDDEAIDLLKASGSGEYLAGPFASGPGTLWGRTRVVVPRLATGTALVGATVVDGVPAARIVIREGISLLISDSDQDDFLRRRVTLHAATRVALEVSIPAAFTVVHLA